MKDTDLRDPALRILLAELELLSRLLPVRGRPADAAAAAEEASEPEEDLFDNMPV